MTFLASLFPLGLTMVGPGDCLHLGRPKGTVSKTENCWSLSPNLWRGSGVKGAWVFPERRCQCPKITLHPLSATSLDSCSLGKRKHYAISAGCEDADRV